MQHVQHVPYTLTHSYKQTCIHACAVQHISQIHTHIHTHTHGRTLVVQHIPHSAPNLLRLYTNTHTHTHRNTHMHTPAVQHIPHSARNLLRLYTNTHTHTHTNTYAHTRSPTHTTQRAKSSHAAHALSKWSRYHHSSPGASTQRHSHPSLAASAWSVSFPAWLLQSRQPSPQCRCSLPKVRIYTCVLCMYVCMWNEIDMVVNTYIRTHTYIHT